ncbi:MAG: hypothetical protein ACOYMV_09665 [Verrucomicrobiia bacterium]
MTTFVNQLRRVLVLHGVEVRWVVVCWGAALFLGAGWIAVSIRQPNPPLVFADKTPDTLLYTLFIQKASLGFSHGDPFLWEHREDPKSVLSFFHLWNQAYGTILRWGGHLSLLVLSIFLSGLWFYALFRFCVRLGQSRPYAFFVSGIQTFFVVNLVYQGKAFGTNLLAYPVWVTEHVRLYPTVTAMAVYCLAALGVLWALERPRITKSIAVAALCGLAAYGRPFDWMVLMGALCLMFLAVGLCGNGKAARGVFVIGLFSALFSAGFVFDFLSYQNLYRHDYFEQLVRGNLQVKAPSHYVKYAALCVAMLGVLQFAHGGALRAGVIRKGEQEVHGSAVALFWLCCLAASSLLVHFKTLLDGGATICGFGYLLVFSIAPWFFMLAAHWVWSRFAPGHAGLFQRRGWVLALFMLLMAQLLAIGLNLLSLRPQFDSMAKRYNVYRWIKAQGGSPSVMLSLGSGIEGGVFTDGWVFFPNPAGAAYVCSAGNAEILERFLLSKLLLTGTVQDLSPLFSPDGLSDVVGWSASRDAKTRFWLGLLTNTLGSNSYVFHPYKNRGELRFRKIELPAGLKGQADFVAFFDRELREVYERCAELERCSTSPDVLAAIQAKYRLDYIYVPSFASRWIREFSPRYRRVQKVSSPLPFDGDLWRIGPGAAQP